MSFAKHQRRELGAKLGNVVFYSLLAVIFLSAIPNGTADDWMISAVSVLLLFCGLLRIFESLLTQKFRIAEPKLLLPLAGILLLAFVQLGVAYGTGSDSYVAKTLGTTNPYETRKFILLFLALLMTAEMLFHYTTDRRRLITLIVLVLTVGAGSALLGFWLLISPVTSGSFADSIIGYRIGFGQFINRNHFAFLMEMTLGVAIGLLIRARLKDGWRLPLGVIAGVALIAAIVSTSRGAILSLLGIGLFAVMTYFVAFRLYGRAEDGDTEVRSVFSGLKTLGIAAVFIVAFLGLGIVTVAFVGGDPVVRRIETIQSEVATAEDDKMKRSEIWSATWELIKDRPLTGVGFGAYGTAITAFDKSDGVRSLQQAHNDYLEVLANGGLVAGGLLVVFVALVGNRIRETLRNPDRLRQAAGFGAAIGIVGVMLHSFVDFGLHILVNALLLLVLIVIGTARIKDTEF